MAKEFRYIKVDETKYWDNDFVKQLGPGAKLIATYVYDATERTFCCELTPSYFLKYVGTDIEPGRELTDQELEHFQTIILENEVDGDHYRHCNSIKDSQLVRFFADTLDEVVEEYRANPW